ncbi:hypothetical protein GW813_15020 [bacterium]|nr:hypothetical protein [bacterium]
MALKFFRIPAEGSPPIEAELNAFLAGHKVLRVKHELVERESWLGGVRRDPASLQDAICALVNPFPRVKTLGFDSQPLQGIGVGHSPFRACTLRPC